MNQANGQGVKQDKRTGPQSNDDPNDSMIFPPPKRSRDDAVSHREDLGGAPAL